MRAFSRALAVWALCALMSTVLVAASERAGVPSFDSWASAERWYEQVGPAAALVSVIAPAAFVVSAWLVLAATAQLIATVVRGPVTTAAAVLLSPLAMQRFVQGLAGASFAVGFAVTVAPPAAALHLAGGEPGTATIELITPGPTATPSPDPVPAPSPSTTTVAPGDSFWSIAEAALHGAAQGRGAAPSTSEIARYWLRVIDANRAILVDPSNPDLIFEGQVVMLPPISQASPLDSPRSPGP